MHRPRRAPAPFLLTAIAGLLLGAIALMAAAQPAQSSEEPTRCQRFAQDSDDRAAAVTGTGRDVVVIGDSYAVGLGLDDPLAGWPSRLPGRVHVHGFSGSGFGVDSGLCPGVSYARRAPEALASDPALVVVEGGLNDVAQDRTAIRAGFRRLMTLIGDRRVLVVGPPAAPTRARGAARVDRELRVLCQRAGVPYLSMQDRRFPYLDDGLHLTAAGHREFGDAVAAALRPGAQRLR